MRLGNTWLRVRAVTRFARATGDLHSLSTVDLRLMALARTLEVAAHGDSHLRELPVRRSTVDMARHATIMPHAAPLML